jgi:uncharacterized protein with HEPN domain
LLAETVSKIAVTSNAKTTFFHLLKPSMTRDRQHINDMITSAQLAVSYLSGKSKADFLNDSLLQDAVNRRIEIVGEAANRLSNEARNSIPELTWRQIIGMRNIIIHQYDAINLDLVWQTVQDYFPTLIRVLEHALIDN